MFYLEEAHRVINILKKDFVMENGALGLERVNGRLLPHDIFSDLGDFLPFLYYFGENEFADNQVRVLKNRLQNNLLVSDFPSFGIKGLAKSYEHTDLLLGLKDHYRYRSNASSKELLLAVADSVIKNFRLSSGIRSFYHHRSGIGIPIIDTRDGTFIEIFSNMYVMLGDIKYLGIATNIFNSLKNLDYYNKYQVLPLYSARPKVLNSFLNTHVKSKFGSSNVFKNNTNTLFGLLTYYLISKNEEAMIMIKKIISSINKYAVVPGGGISLSFAFTGPNERACLSPSFHTIDFLCFLYYSTKMKEYLEFAERIANYWIERQTDIGLFPLYSDGAETFIDSLTDINVSFYRLFELTNNKKYEAAALRCFEGMVRYHAKYDYILSVDAYSGHPVNFAQRTKFLALFLKDLILLDQKQKGRNIYEDKELLSLLRDR